jgi:predicted phosphodiesterase
MYIPYIWYNQIEGNMLNTATVSRRKFFVLTGIAIISVLFPCGLLAKSGKKPILRFGMITDIHYACREPANGRYYSQSLDKVNEFVNLMNSEKVDFIVELGDFKDQDEVPNEANTLKYLSDIESAFHKFNGPTYHVLGNHDMDGITKAQFLERVENTGISKDKNYYSFNQNGVHFIVLDGNFTSDEHDYNKDNYRGVESWIPQKEVSWLKKDLKANNFPAIVFIHQLLDNSKGMKKSVQNAPKVRKIMEASGKVLCVFQGHINAEKHSIIKGIHYYSLISAVEGDGPENNSYVIVNVHKKGTLQIHGFRRASDRKLSN